MHDTGWFSRTFLAAVVLCASPAAAWDRPPELPFRLYQDYLVVVRGNIEDLDGLDFMIDTGSTRTLMDLKIARRLGLRLAERVRVEGISDGEAREVTVGRLGFGAFRCESARILATDLSFAARSGTSIEAVIGLDVLTMTSFSIDYAARRITVGPVAESASGVLLQTIAPLLTVDVTIDRSLLRLVVDTGAPALALFTNRLQSRLPGFRLKGVSGAHGPGGSFRLRDVELSAVRLGPMEWRRVPGLLADVSASSFEADGVLGPRSLRVKRIGFDFVRRRLSWEK